jgi:hypothetical protein
MDEKLIEIREYNGAGYKPLIDYGTWRVAILNYIDELHPEEQTYTERHNETDEVFVLLKGQGVLFVGDGATAPIQLSVQEMEKGKLYNIKRGIWHTVVLSLDASVLLVENCDTGKSNSDYAPLTPEERNLIIDAARKITPL